MFTALAGTGVPVIHFGTGTGGFLERLAEAVTGQATQDVVGVDWRPPGRGVEADRPRAVQGNLDPVCSWPNGRAREGHAAMVEDGRRAATGAAGHIFNLGHGVLPTTPPELLTDLVALVHSL